MSQVRTAHYEGMFLLAQASAADLGGAVQRIRDVLTKSGADIVAMSKWDDRRFAFEIKRQKRGVYILVYFACATDRLVAIERDCNLSETILRSMITSAEHLTLEEMQATDGQKALTDEATLRRQEAESRESEAPAEGQSQPQEAPASS